MGEHLSQLVGLTTAAGGVSVGTGWPAAPVGCGAGARACTEQLPFFPDGLYAFEGALHIYGARDAGPDQPSIWTWNDPALWTSHYGGLAGGLFFFAEDALGVQFAVEDVGAVTGWPRRGRGNPSGVAAVVSFDPETGDRTPVADSLEGWAAAVLQDYPQWTAHPLAHAWQSHHRPLRVGERLLPTIPFVLGGAFAADELQAVPAVLGMRARARLAREIGALGDGAPYALGAWWTDALAGHEGNVRPPADDAEGRH